MTSLPILLALIAADPSDLRFAEPPRVVRDGNQTRITFALSRASDVEVAVVDGTGRVVRHVAAGKIGVERPVPPLAAGLQQSLTWDGKNDDGQPVRGPHQVRVRAGLGVRFERMIGGSPYTGSVVQMPYRAPVNGLAVDPEGRLFVKLMSSVGSHGNSGMWPWHVRQFDRTGRYVRTLLPYPPSTKPDTAVGYTLLDAGDGQFRPANQNSLYPVFAVLGNEILPRTAKDEAGGLALVYVHTEKRRLNFLSLDASHRVREVVMWPDDAKLNCPSWLDIQVALTPDGRYAYYSNVAGVPYDGKKPDDIDPRWPQGRLYRHDLSRSDAVPEPFFDLALPDFDREPYWMPSAWDKKSAAAGIDVDAEGRVLVGDLVNGQVVEITPEGRLASRTPVAWPDRVLVGRKSGTLYVVSRKVSRGYLPPGTLYKITGRGEAAKIVAELPLKGTIGGAMTLDESGDVPVLWLAGAMKDGEKDSEQLWRVEDRGSELAVTASDVLNRDPNAITFVGYMDVDREAELVYVTRSGGTVWRYDGRTGAGGPLPFKAVDVAIGQGGHIYTWGHDGSYQGPIARYTRLLEPAPLPGHEKHTYGYLYGRAGRGSSVCGMDVDSLGRVFATYGSNDCHVQAFGADGRLVDFPQKITVQTNRGPEQMPVAIAGVLGYGGSLRLDREGNLYLLQQGVPADFTPPPGYEKDEAYRHAVGTIYKFRPAGGTIRSASWAVKEVEGAVAAYPDCGPISRWRAVGSCACTKPRFDVDDFGRLYVPNGITFSVSVRDNAGHELVRFGGYGNLDSQGPLSTEPTPAVPLGWPVTVGATDEAIYVGDCLNHRVVRAKKTFAVSASVEAAP